MNGMLRSTSVTGASCERRPLDALLPDGADWDVGAEPSHAPLDHGKLVDGAVAERRELDADRAVEAGAVEDGEDLRQRADPLAERGADRAPPPSDLPARSPS